MNEPTPPHAQPKPEPGSRDKRRAILNEVVDQLNDSSCECLLAVTELDAMKLEDRCDALERALKQARAWGISSLGFSASESGKLARWVDAGMIGSPPSLPDYYV